MTIQNKKPKDNLIKTAEKVASVKELNDKNFSITEIKQDVYNDNPEQKTQG